MGRVLLLAVLAALAAAGVPGFGLGAARAAGTEGGPERAVAVGSKVFTESVILGEMLTLLVRDAGLPARHRAGLGGTRILWEALRAGEIDVYAEYTGTLSLEIFAGRDLGGLGDLRAALEDEGLALSAPLGFENTYGLAVREDLGARLALVRISDLAAYPGLKLGFSNEFLDREDGWPGLKRRYGLPQRDVRGLAHDLAYRGIAAGSIDLVDVYTTDAEIAHYGLRVLADDLSWFPDYQAVLVYRADLLLRAPAAVTAMRRLEGAVDSRTMAALNARVKLAGVREGQAAAGFLDRALGVEAAAGGASGGAGLWARLARRTGEHLGLVAVALALAIAAAVPLGILAARRPRLGQVLLAATGILQTVPSLALFVFLIPVLGIGWLPTVVALFVYSLLPIVRNTHAGLSDIPRPVRESAEAIGLAPGARLRLVELPLAARAILAGIKTSAVLAVGTATLAALIGAGGYGQPILTGIRLADTALVMEGAVPAALMALAFQGLFELAERWVVPRGLRAPASGSGNGV